MKKLIDRVLDLQDEAITDSSSKEEDPLEDVSELHRLLNSLRPRVRVFGCGGCGSNTVARLDEAGLLNDDLVVGHAINTDVQHLLRTEVSEKVLIGRTARGRGAGGDPEKGEKAAYESERTLRRLVDEVDLAFVTCGLGGGTGTGSAHVVARLAKVAGALTIAVVTYPFESEGAQRRQNAEWGLARLREVCDTVMVLPNEKLLSVDGVRDLPLSAAFRVADEILMRSIAGVGELVTKSGLVNLDFEDLRAVMTNGGGVAMITLGESAGPNGVELATQQALDSPLLDVDVSEARGALINVVGGSGLTLGQAESAAKEIQGKISPYAKIIWGATIDPEANDSVRVLLVLTGVRSEQIYGASAHRQLTSLRNRSIDIVG